MAEIEYYDLAIIGGGPGGLSAGIYALRAALNTVLIEKGVPGGQLINTDEVENYPGFSHINGAELAQKLEEHAKAYDIEVMRDDVDAIVPGLTFHKVELADGGSLNCLAIILATGGNPKRLGIPGEDEYYGRGVSYCATCDGFFYRNKTVVVVGGGDSATEEALYLAKLADKVYLVHRRDSLRASMILQERVMKECKIEIIWDTVVTEIKANDEGVCSVALKNVKTEEEKDLSTDGVFIFIGFEPNNHLVPAGTRMNADGFVVTDDKCETNTPGIFVIGDLREKYARQIITAAADGCTAALASAHYVESKKSELGPEACEVPKKKPQP